MCAKYSVFDVADWFLAKANKTGVELKPMKLQKLVYFAYGWFYAYYDQPLFPEKIFAWDYGPVVADLYGEYKRFGGRPIKQPAQSVNFDEDALSILDEIWETYSPCEDFHLSNITHRPASPWYKVYNQYGRYVVIEPHEIRDYFKSLIQKSDA